MPVKNKTLETEASVADYLSAISDDNKRKDCTALAEIFARGSSYPLKMWGTAIVGFGSYHYKYNSGHEGDAPLAGIAARASGISLYLGSEFDNRDLLLSQLGKYKIGKACITIKKLADIDAQILLQMVTNSVAYYREKYR